jgi:hypothetical protein
VEKFKLVLSILFLTIGLVFAYLTYTLYDSIITMGEIKNNKNSINKGLYQSEYIDSAAEGIAISFGIISSVSFLSGTLLLTSIKKREK